MKKHIIIIISILITVQCTSKRMSFSNAVELYNNKKYDLSINILTKLIIDNPQNWELYKYRGASYLYLQKYDSAIIDLQKAVHLGKEKADAFTFNERGNALYKLGDTNRAHDSFLLAFIIDSTTQYVNYNLAVCYTDFNEYEKALMYISNEIKLYPKDAESYFLQSHIYNSINKFELSIISVNKGLAIDSSKSEAYFYKGIALHMLKQYNEALNNFNKAIAIYPDFPDYYLNRCDSYIELERFDEALSDCYKVLSLDQGNKYALKRKEWILKYTE